MATTKHQSLVSGSSTGNRIANYYQLEYAAGLWLREWGITALRVALGVVFLWFGALKIAGVSPVAGMVHTAFPFMPEPYFFVALGIVEMLIGIGLITRIALRATLIVFLIQMAGTMTAPLLAPSLFFVRGNLLLLTADGEFVVKNLVLIASGLVIASSSLCSVFGAPRSQA